MINIIYLTPIVSALLLGSCGWSLTDKSNGLSTGVDNVAITVVQSPAVTISPISTIPTNGKEVGSYNLIVQNNTGEVITLDNINLSNSSNVPITSRIRDKLSRTFGGIGYDVRVPQAGGCKIVAINGSCSIPFTPDSIDGASSIQLNFTTSSNKNFAAASLINYSPNLANQNGFIVSNDNISNISTINDYSIIIPFVAADDYDFVAVASDVTPLSSSVNCGIGSENVESGSNCTAVLTMPSPPKNASYANTINIIGTKSNGTNRVFSLSSGATYGKIGTLTLSNALVINPTIQNGQNGDRIGTVLLVNNGTNLVSGVNSKTTTLLGPLVDDKSPLLSDGISCGGNILAPGGSIDAGAVCEVKFTVPDTILSGYDKFEITYNDGLDPSVSKYTEISYTSSMENSFESATYILKGKLDFSDTIISPEGNGILKNITVINNGSESVVVGDLIGLPTSDGFIIENTSSCNGSTLQVNERCMFYIRYNPQIDTPLGEYKYLYVDMKDKNGQEVNPVKYIPLKYSATGVVENENSIKFLDNNLSFIVRSGNNHSQEHIVRIQNLGKSPYTLNNTVLQSGIWPSANKGILQINGPKILGSSNLANPLESVVFVDGSANNINRQILKGKTAKLVYTYGNATDVVNESVTQAFEGKLGSLNIINNLNINYKSTVDGITAEPIPSELGQSCMDGNCAGLALVDGTQNYEFKSTLASESDSFTLLKSNMLRATFIYSNGSTAKTGFYVDGNDIPFYGFKIGEVTDKVIPGCPTAKDKATTLEANSKCKVIYYFLGKTIATADPYFYTEAANGLVQEVSMPPYIIQESGKTRVFRLNQKFKFTANAFASFTEEANEVKDTNIVHEASEAVYKISITAHYSGSDLKDTIMVKLDPHNLNARIASGGTCPILPNVATRTAGCNLYVIAPVSATEIPVIYSLSTDSNYNWISRNVTIVK